MQLVLNEKVLNLMQQSFELPPPPHPAPIEGYPAGAFTITVSEMQ